MRLVEPGDGTPDTRRRAQLSELLPAGGDEGRMGTVLDAVVGARLVTMDETGVEVAHEALIREWPRLQSWLDEDRDGLRLQRHLTAAATAWDQLGRDAERALPRAAAGRRPRLAGHRSPDLRARATVPRREPGGRGARRRAAGPHQPPAPSPSHGHRA